MKKIVDKNKVETAFTGCLHKMITYALMMTNRNSQKNETENYKGI